MITLLTGPNEFRIRQSLTGHLRSAAKEFGEEGITQIKVTDIAPTDLPQLLRGASLFSPRRLVVLHHPAEDKAIWEALASYIEADDDDLALLIVEPQPDKRTKTYKLLQKHATVTVHEALSDKDLVGWVITTMRQMGADISDELARFLLLRAGTDQWRLESEIMKLASTGQTITKDKIRDIVEPEPSVNAFDVLETALRGDTSAMSQQISDLTFAEDPYRFFGLLSSQVTTLVIAGVANGQSAETIAKRFSLHPYAVKKTMATARSFSADQLTRLVEIVADTDVKLKSTGVDPWFLIELCLGQLSTLKKIRT